MRKRRTIVRLMAAIMGMLLLFTDTGSRWIQSGGFRKVYAAETLAGETLAQAAVSGETEGYVDYLAKAEELGTPLAVYNYLKNHVNYEYYEGKRKGSAAVYDSLGGNDVDQAILLSDMLEHLGYDTRYVRGRIRLYPEQLTALTGEGEVRDAASVLGLSGAVTVVSDASGTGLWVEMDHAWVEAYLPYGDYRGNGRGEGESLWIPLDTGIKRYQPNETIYDKYEEYGIGEITADSVSGGDILAAEAYVGALQDNLTRLLAENPDLYLTGERIVREELPYLPLSLQYPVVEVYGRYETAAVFAEDGITFTLAGKELATLTPEELYCKRLVLAYEEAEGGVQAFFSLDGEILARGSVVPLGSKESFRMEVVSGRDVSVIDNQLDAGGMYQITCDTQSITAREIEVAADSLKALQEKANESNILEEAQLGAILDYIGKMYFAQVDMTDRLLKEQYEVHASRSLSVGIMGYTPILQREPATGELTRTDRGSFFADIDLDSHRVAEENGDAKAYCLMSGMLSSAYESIIWEQFTGLPGISTLSLLQEAAEEGTELKLLTSDNFAAERDSLRLRAEVLAEIEGKLREGKLVLVPAGEQRVIDWTGVGYLVLDGETFSGEYLINGGLTGEGLGGESISGGAASTAVEAAFWVNLVASVVDLVEAFSMIPKVISLFAMGGPVGILGGVVLGAVVLVLAALAVVSLVDTISDMNAYRQGDLSKGEELITSACFNLLAAGIVGAGGPILKGVAGSLTKQFVEGAIGKDLAERILREAVNPDVVIDGIRRMRKQAHRILIIQPDNLSDFSSASLSSIDGSHRYASFLRLAYETISQSYMISN